MSLISSPAASADADPLAAALHYAAQGWAVLPLHTPVADGRCSCRKSACKDVGKHPRTQHGLKGASTDPGMITNWWRKWPDANLGIRTGAESDLVVLDVDVITSGRETLARLATEHGALPPTLVVETGGGGCHLYFRHPGGRVTTNAGQLGPGLDVRGDGGYVVAPPSLHRSGQRYRWAPETVAGRTPAPLPSWILGAATRPARSGVPASEEARIPEGQRNRSLTSIAGKLRRDGLSEAAIRAALLETNDERCDPPLDECEVAKIAKSVARYPVESSGVPELPKASASEITRAQKQADHLQAILSATLAVIENPYLKKEAVVALRIVKLLEHFHGRTPAPDGFHRISDNDIADAWTRSTPIVKRSSITRAKQRLREWGLFEIQTRAGSRVERPIHPETGEIISRRVPSKETWIRRDRTMLEQLQQLAEFDGPSATGKGTVGVTTQSGRALSPDDEVLVSVERVDAQMFDTTMLPPMPQIGADTYVTTPLGGPTSMHRIEASTTSEVAPLQAVDPAIESVPP